MLKHLVNVIIDVPVGDYCCHCDFIYHEGDFRYCKIYGIPLVANDDFYRKCDECKEACKKCS